MRYVDQTIFATVAILFLAAAPLAAQESRSLNLGTLEYVTNEALSADRIWWPRGWDWHDPGFDQEMLHRYGVVVGTERSWTGEDGVARDYQVAQVIEHTFSDAERVMVPEEMRRVFRNPHPRKIVDGTNWTPINASQDPVDPTIPADGLIYTHLTTWTGIDVERWAYAFANEDHDDFILLEYKFTNRSGEPRNDVYFGLNAQTSADTYQAEDIWGTYYGIDYPDYVAGDATADSMRVWYSWDANEDRVQADSRAQPDEVWGNFHEPQFMTYAVVHADRATDDERDDPQQPVKAGFSNRQLAPHLGTSTHERVYNYLATSWEAANPSSYAHTVNRDREEVSDGMFRVLRPDVDLENYQSSTEQEKLFLSSFGPYQMDPGEDVRIVMAFAGGSIPHRLAIDAGRAYENGYSQQRTVDPLPQERDVYDMHGNHIVRGGDVHDTFENLLAEGGQTLTKDEKNSILEVGKEIAFETADRAVTTWEEGDVRAGEGSFEVPLAPAAPSLTVESQLDQTYLEWGDEAANDQSAGSIVGYRIYRNYYRSPELTLPTDTTHVLLEEVGPGVREYEDTDVIRGEDYYYYVTAVNEQGIESSKFQNRTGTSPVRADQAVSPERPPDENWQDNVVVVPNPYHVRGSQKYEGKRLNFLNLPPHAKIRIYTASGDLVQVLDHDSGTGDRDWQHQEVFNTMEIVSGVYVYVVEETTAGGQATGQREIGQFVVIK